MPDTFFSGPNWEQSSGPIVNVDVLEANVWPVDDNSGSGVKDELFDGAHPIVAVGGRTAADGRPLNLTGVVMKFDGVGSGTANDRVVLNIASGMIVRQYVANVLTYAGGVATTFETAPVVGQPVYVDDSDDLGEGVTISMSPLNDADVANPRAGVLWYCQDEITDRWTGGPGGARAAYTFDTVLADEFVEQEYCILLLNQGRDLA